MLLPNAVGANAIGPFEGLDGKPHLLAQAAGDETADAVACQSVADMMSASVTPSGRLSRSRTIAFLLPSCAAGAVSLAVGCLVALASQPSMPQLAAGVSTELSRSRLGNLCSSRLLALVSSSRNCRTGSAMAGTPPSQEILGTTASCGLTLPASRFQLRDTSATAGGPSSAVQASTTGTWAWRSTSHCPLMDLSTWWCGRGRQLWQDLRDPPATADPTRAQGDLVVRHR